ncbi:hypothetical protein [Methylomagnum sp.]
MRKWTEEERKRQSERIRQWRPWEQSTGPKTGEGKAIASRNADQGGQRPMLRQLSRALREQQRALDEWRG